LTIPILSKPNGNEKAEQES